MLLLSGCDQIAKFKVIEIGCAGPLTGDQAQLGIDTCQGVSLAIDEANQKNLVPGYTLKIQSLDDQHTPAQAVNVAKKFVSDRDVMADRAFRECNQKDDHGPGPGQGAEDPRPKGKTRPLQRRQLVLPVRSARDPGVH